MQDSYSNPVVLASLLMLTSRRYSQLIHKHSGSRSPANVPSKCQWLSMMNAKFRAAKRQDLQEISTILLEAIVWMEDNGTSLWSRQEVSPASIESDITQGKYHVAIGPDSKILATFMLSTIDEIFWPEEKAHEAVYIHKIAVRRNYSGQNLTRHIIDFAKLQAQQAGIQRLRLDCDRTRPKLNNLYQSLGFVYHSQVDLPNYSGARYELLL